jgi:uncharacterized protein YjeT (DUF2065 family)
MITHDLLTALALILILEGFMPGVAPERWQKMMQEVAKWSPKGIRIAGIISMLAGAFLLQFLH